MIVLGYRVSLRRKPRETHRYGRVTPRIPPPGVIASGGTTSTLRAVQTADGSMEIVAGIDCLAVSYRPRPPRTDEM